MIKPWQVSKLSESQSMVLPSFAWRFYLGDLLMKRSGDVALLTSCFLVVFTYSDQGNGQWIPTHLHAGAQRGHGAPLSAQYNE